MPRFGSPNVNKLEAGEDCQGLINALGHKQSDVCQAAAEALGHIGAPAVGPLVAAFKAGDRDVRSTRCGCSAR